MKKDLSEFSYWEEREKTYEDLDDVKSKRTAYKIIGMIKSMGLNAGSWILDAGCGKGDITRLVRENIRHSNVVGIDLSKGMIDGANRKVIPGLKFVQTNFFDFISEGFPFFDLVIMSLFIHHLTEKGDQLAVNKAYNLIKNNGFVLIAEAIPPEEELFEYYEEIFKIKEKRNCYLLSDLLKIVRSAGFEDIRFMTYRFDLRLLSWLNDPTLSEEKKKLLYSMHINSPNRFKKAYAMDPLPGGDYRLKCKMCLVVGRKTGSF